MANYLFILVIAATHWSTQAIEREYDVYIQKKLRHKNILPLLGIYHEMLDSQSHEHHISQRRYRMCRMNLAFPLMENGDLNKYVNDNPHSEPVSLVCTYVSNLIK